MSPPTGTVTFLLTDIEGSTRLRQEHGAEFEAALTLHHRLLRELFAGHGGHEVKELGDGFIAVFERPIEAAACAIAAQQGLADASWPAGVELRVRMGVHTGEIELRDGEYRGLTLHHGARLLEAAHGGQILCSEGTAKLLRGALAPGLRLLELGEFRLRDMQTAERLCQVCDATLPTTPFPPPRAEKAEGGHLPATFTPFFGRERELEWLHDALARDDTRLVTITGAGGTGKSRLAIEAARSLIDVFHGAVWFVPLHEISDAAFLGSAIATAMRLAHSPQVDPMSEAVAALCKQPALLVLDNFEQLVEHGAELVHLLLQRAPSLKCLVTSRQTLELTSEVDCPIAPLPTPGDPHDVDAVARCASVRLFVDRARAARPDFEITGENARAVGELCRRLEGIPLALELAAARVALLTPARMVAQLDRRLDFLATRKRDIPERHRTLRAAIEWSYRSLPTELQRFFVCLSVFRGGWTLEAAEVVCDEPEALDHLERLRQCSMVLLEPPAFDDAEPRFGLLEALREFAAEQLPDDERAVLRGRHARHLATLAERHAANGPEPDRWWSGGDRANALAALDWLETSQDAEGAMLVWLALYESGTWDQAGRTAEARRHAELVLTQGRGESPTPLRATVLRCATQLAWRQADYAGMRALAEEALAAARELGLTDELSHSLTALGTALQDQGCPEEARAALEEALQLARQSRVDGAAGESLFRLGVLEQTQGNYACARQLYEDSFRVRGWSLDDGGHLGQFGILAREQGDYTSAHTILESACETARRWWGDAWGCGWLTAQFAAVLLCEGEVVAASAFMADALQSLREDNDLRGIVFCLHTQACAAECEGDLEGARRLLEEALAIYRHTGYAPGRAECLATLAAVNLALNDTAEAQAMCCEGVQLAARLGERKSVAECLEVGAALGAAQDDLERAAQLLAAAAALRDQIGTPVVPWNRDNHQRCLATVREALGEKRFAAAWTRGQAMTWLQAVAYAVASP